MGIGWIRRKLKRTGYYYGGWDDLEKWFDREPEVDGRGTMSECSRVFWRYWSEIPESGRAYEEVEYDVGKMMLEHWLNHLEEDYEEAKAKVKEMWMGRKDLRLTGRLTLRRKRVEMKKRIQRRMIFCLGTRPSQFIDVLNSRI